MEGSFTNGWHPDLTDYENAVIPRTDYIADTDVRFFAVAFDRHGRLGWKHSRIIDDDPGYGDAHIIEVLCEDTPDRYLAYLKSIGVSYIFAGIHQMDISVAVEKLHRLFGINKLLLEGGSILNGAFLRADLIDELSLVTAAVSADADDKPLFDGGEYIDFKPLSADLLEDGTVWLRYKRSRQL